MAVLAGYLAFMQIGPVRRYDAHGKPLAIPSPPEQLAGRARATTGPAAIGPASSQQGEAPENAGTAKLWTSAIAKTPVEGPLQLDTEGLQGDYQADRKHHGGPDKALCAYPAEHYPHWNREFAPHQFEPGSFGENLTLVGLLEGDVCIGDVFQMGECNIQISQPREPCWKLARKWQLPKLTVRVQQTRRTGWYFRVLEPGACQAGQSLQLRDRLYPQFTVAWANDVLFAKPRRPAADLELAHCPALSEAWQTSLLQRVATKGNS